MLTVLVIVAGLWVARKFYRQTLVPIEMSQGESVALIRQLRHMNIHVRRCDFQGKDRYQLGIQLRDTFTVLPVDPPMDDTGSIRKVVLVPNSHFVRGHIKAAHRDLLRIGL